MAIFNELLTHKDEIEHEYRAPLEWQPLEDRRACRIRERWEGIGYRNEDQWPELQEKLIDAMIRLEATLKAVYLPTSDLAARFQRCDHHGRGMYRLG